ncbi:hypothetical protein TAGGR_1169 [Thermodesulfovibrio aggregans]|uniref:Uncharacterized protein n=1 Tax=Thermodesulfovibrio aggregans TaxID=86166 RepID=A0A0U9HMC2_9BACT|nr:Sfum_1244 family protein [Thermodesulfovibrio aggregans]GAQ94004.1 hypothetical protein TAGGR_1169 [Thermodesulfovibrio aggregans]
MLDPDFFNTVRYNCNVSDANYWGYFSICTLLLRLRQLFKIEKDLEPWDKINNEDIFPWIEKKEETWKELEDAKLIPIRINGKSYSPFDIDNINNAIVNDGFVYGAGFALFMKPSFFVGLIHNVEKIEGYDVYFVDKEVVRDIFSSPGMSIEKKVYIRLTDIKYRIWEELHSWIGKKGLYEYILKKFGNPSEWQNPFREFKEIIDKYSKIVLYHEIAEQQVSIPKWNEMIKECNNSKTEHILRGIKDFVADFSEKGPLHKAFIEKDKEFLALYIIFQGAYQKKILKPALLQIEKALIADDWDAIEEVRIRELNKWKNNYEQILKIFESQGIEAVKNLTNKIFERGGIN